MNTYEFILINGNTIQFQGVTSNSALFKIKKEDPDLFAKVKRYEKRETVPGGYSRESVGYGLSVAYRAVTGVLEIALFEDHSLVHQFTTEDSSYLETSSIRIGPKLYSYDHARSSYDHARSEKKKISFTCYSEGIVKEFNSLQDVC